MQIHIIALETVLHPETRRELFVEGQIYHVSYLQVMAEETGFDNIKCQLCMNFHAAFRMQKQLFP
jgi:hypothetical protein